MKKFTDYIDAEIKEALNENTSQVGKTDVFSGTDVMGPHHHEYLIWNEFGYGWTSDSICEPARLNTETHITKVGGHTHLILNGIVQPAGDGHSLELLTPWKVCPDTQVGSCLGPGCMPGACFPPFGQG